MLITEYRDARKDALRDIRDEEQREKRLKQAGLILPEKWADKAANAVEALLAGM